MQIPQIPTSRWFIYGSSGLLIFLCLAVLVAGLILTVQSSQVRVGQVGGSSMEPALEGPRYVLVCSACEAENPFAIDAWTPRRPALCRCCNQSIMFEDQTLGRQRPGAEVSYIPARLLKANGVWGRKVQHGDIVVLERAAGARKEIKRVVALPGEELTIRDGDLWIQQRRYEKSLDAALNQSVLIAAWDRDRCQQSLDAFLETTSLPPTNELSINAHDSHELVRTSDFGIALRCVEPIRNTNLVFSLADGNRRFRIEIRVPIPARDGWTVACNDIPLMQQSVADSHREVESHWIILAMIDGRMLVGDESGNRFAQSLRTLEQAGEGIDDPLAPIRVVSRSGDLEFDLAMLFRDLVYRGYGDLAQETIPAGPGYVVLGDNVSISDDSRGPPGNQFRCPWDRIRGVVVPNPDPLARLLRQRSLESDCPCE